MSDYPDPDEEFELMYEDEFELLREQEEDIYTPVTNIKPSVPSKKSLDFGEKTGKQLNDSLSDIRELNNELQISQELFSSVENDATNIFNEPPTNGSQNSIHTNDQNGDIPSQTAFVCSNNKKRTVEDLFGDITDLNDLNDDFIYDLPNPCSKKLKMDDVQAKLELIDQIVEMRKLNRERSNIVTVVGSDRKGDYNERDKRNMSFRVPKYPFIGVTRYDKEKVYVRFHSEEYEKDEIQRIVKENTFSGVMGDAFKEVWKQAKDLVEMQNTIQSEATNSDVLTENQDDETTQLWVDLYKPKKYFELLSDESTNRIMLRWIKLWDKIVFNRRPKQKIKKPIEEKKMKNKYFKPQFELDTELDEHGRPKFKVALLCGPPGLGKTTLAHMVARQSGYNVVEINASDDRSTEAFKTALENATQMRSVVDQENRPNCLVFDEIDGAPQASIDFLVKFVNGTATKKNKKGKSQTASILKRPIICICNDVYVPALRPLRQIAFVINFPPTSSTRLSERLMEIAKKQHIKTDLGAMRALAEKSNNDIRSCLSVLYFFKAQNKPVRLSDIYKASVGQKDLHKGLFAVWSDIFNYQRPKKRVQEVQDDTNVLRDRMQNIVQTVSSFGDYDRVAQGVFENYPVLKLGDATFESICKCLEWFIFNDLINRQIQTLQNYSISPYLPYGFVVWHFIFATYTSQRINYPSVDYEMRQKENRQIAIVSEVLRGLQPSVRIYCARIMLILDVLPLITIIIVPNFRPVSMHLYTKAEKESILHVVSVMVDYNLNYVQERQNDGTFTFNLEPNIEAIVYFDKTIRRRTLSYPNRQIISREIEAEKVRRLYLATNMGKSDSKQESDKNKTTTPTNKRTLSDISPDNTNLPNHLQTLKFKKPKSNVPIVKKDFFGRIISPSKDTDESKEPDLGNDLWYQFKEGYSNAVRKRITISYLK